MVFRTAEDTEEIRRLYWDEGLTLRQIADKLYCSDPTVGRYMARNGIPRRGRAEARPQKLYDVGGRKMTAMQIAEETGAAYSTIRGRMARGWSGEKLLLPPGKQGGRKHGHMA